MLCFEESSKSQRICWLGALWLSSQRGVKCQEYNSEEFGGRIWTTCSACHRNKSLKVRIGEMTRPVLSEDLAGRSIFRDVDIDWRQYYVDSGASYGHFVPDWPRYAIRNGFVWQVACTLEWFTEERAQDLFSKWPIESVVLVDRRPLASIVVVGEYFWSSNNIPDGGYVPRPIWNNLEFIADLGNLDVPDARSRYYRGENSAYSALDSACVSYGRRLAGLTPLKGDDSLVMAIEGAKLA